MARPGVPPARIQEVIQQLDTEGAEVTVTAVRERLGSGSYSTIGTVLNDWRQTRAQAARPAIPEMPEPLYHLVRHLWAEAWKSADAAHDPERHAFDRERTEHEKAKQELAAEIRRLEAELERLAAEGESCRETLAQRQQELEAARVELTKATSTASVLQGELERLRTEGQKAIENLTAWVERASKAEMKLEEAEKARIKDGGSLPGGKREE